MATGGGFMLWHWFGSIVLWTVVMIAVLYLVYFFLKNQGGNFAGSIPGLETLTNGKNRVHSPQALQIESVLQLEPRKNLYIVRSGVERFVVSTSMEGTRFMSKLHDLTSDELRQREEEELTRQQQPASAGGSAGLANHFTESLRWVLSGRAPKK